VSANSTENVLNAFEKFIEEIVKDQIENRKGEDAMMEDLWDESIKVRTRMNQ
jgi:hypothetical protein